MFGHAGCYCLALQLPNLMCGLDSYYGRGWWQTGQVDAEQGTKALLEVTQ